MFFKVLPLAGQGISNQALCYKEVTPLEQNNIPNYTSVKFSHFSKVKKHLSLNETLASNIVRSVSADRIVIVCKKAEQKVILSLLNQIGWQSRIQAIITEDDLVNWYAKAMSGQHHTILGDKIIEIISREIELEFPTTKGKDFDQFYRGRKYHKLKDITWA
ncbi:MAG: HaeII family restriction endonuclease [Chitinophagales bacterium]